MTDERQLARLLRDGMVAEARQVSAGPEFAERAIGRALASGGPGGPERRWQNWVLPAAAAVLVALLVGSVLIGTKLLHSAGPASRPSPTLSQPVISSPPPSQQTTPAPSSPATGHRSGGATSKPAAGPAGGPVPAGFTGWDLTWVSNDFGWALGTAPCGNPPCTSILRTGDGGKSWVGIPAPRAFLVPTDTCNSACDRISNLRFANQSVGYAFGPNSLYLTTDGGASWHQQAGGYAYGLEVVAGSVLRISAQAAGCEPGCQFRVQRAAIGSDSWQDLSLPAGGRSARAQLAASGHTVVLVTRANPAGGAEDATSVLFTSHDGGTSWQKLGEPCPQAGGREVDSVQATVAPDGSISVLCQPRLPGRAFTMTSTDGAHFVAGAPLPQQGGVLGAGSATDLVVVQDRIYRSTDSGAHWTAVEPGPPGATYIGFESATVGRVIGPRSNGGPAGTWTTTDGGRSWTFHSFG